MNSEDGQVYSIVYCNILVLLSTIVFSQNINKQNLNIADETLTDYSFLSRYNYTKIKKIIWKDDIEFVTEFPCLLGHSLLCSIYWRGVNFNISNWNWMNIFNLHNSHRKQLFLWNYKYFFASHKHRFPHSSFDSQKMLVIRVHLYSEWSQWSCKNKPQIHIHTDFL